jgi:hypothetical protein
MLDEHVCQLIESLWIESIGDLNKILSIPPESIALKTVRNKARYFKDFLHNFI